MLLSIHGPLSIAHCTGHSSLSSIHPCPLCQAHRAGALKKPMSGQALPTTFDAGLPMLSPSPCPFSVLAACPPAGRAPRSGKGCVSTGAAWAPTSASQSSGVVAARAGRPPWVAGTVPCVSAVHTPALLGAGADGGCPAPHRNLSLSPLLLWLREWRLYRTECLLLCGWGARGHLPR